MSNKLLLNFSGGMNTKTSHLLLKDEECELILNYHLDLLGALKKRYGYETFASQPEAGKTINGLYQFNDTSSSSGEQLMVANNSGDTNGVIYYNNSGTWTAAKSNDTASKKTRFTSFVDYVFRVNGADVVATSANGSTWGTTNAPATITPKYAGVFQDRVYFANGASSNYSRVWFSGLPSSGSISWDTANDWLDVNPDDGDEITALENNGNRLLIFKNRSLYRWTFGQVEPDRLIGVGTSSQESVKTNLDLGITFFSNPIGIYAYTGGRPKLISRKVQKFVDQVSNWSDVFAEVDEDHYYLSVGNVTVDGRAFNNCVLVYHISLDAWTVYTTATPIKWFARLIETAPVERVYFGSNDGRTYKFLEGTDDNGSDIEGDVVTKEYLLQYPKRTNVDSIDVFAQQRVAANVLLDLDRLNDWETLGMLQDRVTPLKPRRRECNSIRVRFTDNSANTSIFEGFNVEHEPKSKRDEVTHRRKRK